MRLEPNTRYAFARSKNIDKNSPDRFDSRYFRLSDHEFKALKETDTLTASIANKIDNQLRILGKSVPARPLGNDRYCQWVLQW
jgi:hypothetical protein